MSFLDMAQGGGPARELGAIRPASGAQQASDVDRANQQLIQRVFRMRTAVSRLKADVSRLGGAGDTVELRKGLASAIARIQDDAQDIKQQLLAIPPERKSRQTAKILSDFEVTLKDFQTTMKVAKGKEAATLPRPSPAAAAALAQERAAAEAEAGGQDAAEQQALLQAQRRRADAAVEREMAANEALIDERDQGIAEIQQQIGEVNEIFQDLAVLVSDQGEQLNDIEANIVSVAERTHQAVGELGQAQRSQRAARNRMCWVLAIVGLVLAVLVLVLTV